MSILLVLAAGVGSRYGGAKQIESVGRGGETLLEFAAYDAKQAGFSKIVYVIRKDMEEAFHNTLFTHISKHIEVEYTFQSIDKFLNEPQQVLTKNRKKPWGTIHALICAKDYLTLPFAVINADDYYGRSAFKSINRHLLTLSNSSSEHAMVGYVLENTLSRFGSVSRGVCTIKNDYLTKVEEHTKIAFDGDTIYSGEKTILTGKEWVSMNLFGFAPSVLKYFIKYFEEFINNNAESENECFLPSGVNSLLATGKSSMRFFKSEEKWFGMTYPEDKALVCLEIENKVNAGYYPKKLWIEKR